MSFKYVKWDMKMGTTNKTKDIFQKNHTNTIKIQNVPNENQTHTPNTAPTDTCSLNTAPTGACSLDSFSYTTVFESFLLARPVWLQK